MNICSYLVESSQNVLEETLTNIFFRYRSWFETFLYLLIGDGGEAPFESILLTHYSCC